MRNFPLCKGGLGGILEGTNPHKGMIGATAAPN
jgi:hypothetical protein